MILILEIAGGVRVDLIGGFSSFLLMVESCSNNEIVAAKCGLLGAFIASTFGRWFMVPIFGFNINNLWSSSYLFLLHHCLHRILVQPSGLVFISAIAYFCSYSIQERDRNMPCQVTGSYNPESYYLGLTHVVQG